MKIILFIFLAFGTFLSLSVTAKVDVKTFNSAEIDNLEVENFSGTVYVKATKSPKSKVTIETVNMDKDCTMKVGLKDKNLEIKVDATNVKPSSVFNLFSGDTKTCEINFAIEVPAKTTTKLKTISGNFKMEKMNGDAKLKTISGNFDLTGNVKNLVSKSVSGDMDLTGDFSNLELESVSGDIKVNGQKIENVKIKTVSGDADLTGLNVEGMDFNSVSGDAKITFTKTAKLIDLKFKTVSGDVDIFVPQNSKIENFEKTRGNVTFRDYSNGNKFLIKGKTVSGEVQVTKM